MRSLWGLTGTQQLRASPASMSIVYIFGGDSGVENKGRELALTLCQSHNIYGLAAGIRRPLGIARSPEFRESDLSGPMFWPLLRRSSREFIYISTIILRLQYGAVTMSARPPNCRHVDSTCDVGIPRLPNSPAGMLAEIRLPDFIGNYSTPNPASAGPQVGTGLPGRELRSNGRLNTVLFRMPPKSGIRPFANVRGPQGRPARGSKCGDCEIDGFGHRRQKKRYPLVAQDSSKTVLLLELLTWLANKIHVYSQLGISDLDSSGGAELRQEARAQCCQRLGA